jgi:Lsr2
MQILERYDDLAWKRSQSKIVATHTERFTFRGVTVELDLADANFEDVCKYLTELAEAGTVVRGRVSEVKHGPRKSGSVVRTTRENKLLREWVRSNNIMARKGKPRLAFTTEQSGKYYYPQWLWEQYDMAMEVADGLGSSRSGQRTADAGHRGGEG